MLMSNNNDLSMARVNVLIAMNVILHIVSNVLFVNPVIRYVVNICSEVTLGEKD